MPKKARHLWSKVLDFDNLLLAARKASRGRQLRPEVLLYNAKLEENLLTLRESLVTGTWQPGAWKSFTVFEPKERLIHAPAFPDRVLHHALVNVIEPCFERRFIADSYACRKGKGTHRASAKLSAMLSALCKTGQRGYFLKADIAKYFPSINHDIVLRLVRRVLDDADVVRVLELIVRASGFQSVGLPIGALTSQLLANVYLDALDHHIKDELGIRYYVRYMDDFIILDTDKAKLQTLLQHLRVWLTDNLALHLNSKTGIAPVTQGIDFAGYRHWATHKLPRKRIVTKARRTFRKLSKLFAIGCTDLSQVRAVVMSFLGYMKHCCGYLASKATLQHLILERSLVPVVVGA